MAHPSNTWQGKRILGFYDGHDRHAGDARKAMKHKRRRRRGNASMREMLRPSVILPANGGLKVRP